MSFEAGAPAQMARFVAGFMDESVKTLMGFHEVGSGALLSLCKREPPARRSRSVGAALICFLNPASLKGAGRLARRMLVHGFEQFAARA
jgi:hypothetical protein